MNRLSAHIYIAFFVINAKCGQRIGILVDSDKMLFVREYINIPWVYAADRENAHLFQLSGLRDLENSHAVITGIGHKQILVIICDLECDRTRIDASSLVGILAKGVGRKMKMVVYNAEPEDSEELDNALKQWY